jgi:nitroreductase
MLIYGPGREERMTATAHRGDSRHCSACSPDGATSVDALLERAAESGMLAPSAYNTQPWLFRLVGGALEIHADVSRARAVADPRGRELFLACGAALENVRIALRHLGRDVDIAILPDRARPQLVARVRAGSPRPATLTEARFFTALPKRRSNRARFYARPLPLGVAPSIEQAAEATGATLRFLHGATTRDALAHIIWNADREQARDAQFRMELATWLRANQTDRPDGMPGFAFGLSTPMAALAPLVLRTIPSELMRVVRDSDLAREAPLLGVLMTPTDEPHDWIRAGQGLERSLLCATSLGLSTGVMNQAIQVDETRARVRRLLNTQLWPLAVMRFGFGPDTRPTPRRALKDVLVRERDNA